nr:hypothetical protein [uncultured Thiodictyon sp.]
MEKNAVAHAKQIDTLFPVTLAVVYPLNRKVIEKNLNRVIERHAMITPVYCGFGVVPLKNIILHDATAYPYFCQVAEIDLTTLEISKYALHDISARTNAQIKGEVLTRLLQLALRHIYSQEPTVTLRAFLALMRQIADQITASGWDPVGAASAATRARRRAEARRG